MGYLRKFVAKFEKVENNSEKSENESSEYW